MNGWPEGNEEPGHPGRRVVVPALVSLYHPDGTRSRTQPRKEYVKSVDVADSGNNTHAEAQAEAVVDPAVV